VRVFCVEHATVETSSSETDSSVRCAGEQSSSPVCRAHQRRREAVRHPQSHYHLLDAEHYAPHPRLFKPLFYQYEHPGLYRQLQLMQA